MRIRLSARSVIALLLLLDLLATLSLALAWRAFAPAIEVALNPLDATHPPTSGGTVRWAGYLPVAHAGAHTFTVPIGARVIVDRVPVDMSHQERGYYQGSRQLDGGVHSIEVLSEPGTALWGTAQYSPPIGQTLPLRRVVTASTLLAGLALWLPHGLAFGASLAILALLFLGVARVFAEPRDGDARSTSYQPIHAVLFGCFLTGLLGITWGLPAYFAWAPDEVVPLHVIEAVEAGFSNGWHHLYPPLSFLIHGLLYSPFLFLASHGLMNLLSPYTYYLLFLLLRFASLSAACVVVLGVYRLAITLGYTKRSAVYSALLILTIPAFAYYQRVANVDMLYVMWVVLAWHVYACLTRDGFTYRRCLSLGVLAALAVATKDQAYGFFPLIAGHLVTLTWHATSGPWLGRLREVATNRQLWTGLIAFAGTFIVAANLLTNATGFQLHIQQIMGPASQNYRMFDGDARGQAQLIGSVVALSPWCLGWPILATALVGAGLEAKTRALSRLLIVALPPVSYYAFAIAVIGYFYDRFLLAMFVLPVILAGHALDRLQSGTREHWAGAATAAAVVGLSALYGASVPLLMLNDSRYYVEEWLDRNVPTTAVVGYYGRPEYLPRLHDYDAVEVRASPVDLAAADPDVYVVNRAYSLRNVRAFRFFDALEDGTLGYARVLRHRPVVGTLLELSGRLSPERENRFTNLNKINPEIRIYIRRSHNAGPSSEAR